MFLQTLPTFQLINSLETDLDYRLMKVLIQNFTPENLTSINLHGDPIRKKFLDFPGRRCGRLRCLRLTFMDPVDDFMELFMVDLEQPPLINNLARKRIKSVKFTIIAYAFFIQQYNEVTEIRRTSKRASCSAPVEISHPLRCNL